MLIIKSLVIIKHKVFYRTAALFHTRLDILFSFNDHFNIWVFQCLIYFFADLFIAKCSSTDRIFNYFMNFVTLVMNYGRDSKKKKSIHNYLLRWSVISILDLRIEINCFLVFLEMTETCFLQNLAAMSAPQPIKQTSDNHPTHAGIRENEENMVRDCI